MISIERFEGGFALCEGEDKTVLRLPRETLPAQAREGDFLVETAQGRWEIEPQATSRRRNEAVQRIANLSAAGRREEILQVLSQTKGPMSATALAEKFRVSRQAIVGDVALLRAKGAGIIATPRGYCLEIPSSAGLRYTVACRHQSPSLLLRELYAVVDNGGTLLDVTVEHPVYGELTGQLRIGSRFEADGFVASLAEGAAPLSLLTGGLHLHTLLCPDEACFCRIQKALRDAGILITEGGHGMPGQSGAAAPDPAGV